MFSITLLLCSFLFLSCNNNNEDQQTSHTTDEPIVNIYENEATKYRVVRPTNSTDEEFNASYKLSEAFSKNNIKIESVRDKDSDIIAEYEILIGETNRPESIEANKQLKINDYIIAFSGTKIVIIGGSPSATFEAVGRFIDEYLVEDNSSLNLPKSMYIIEKDTYAIADLQINGVDLREFKIIRSATANKIEIYASDYFREIISERTGINLKIINDSSEISKYEIRIGSTNRSENFSDDYKYATYAGEGNLVLCGGKYSITQAVINFLNNHIPLNSSETVNVVIDNSINYISTQREQLPAETTLNSKHLVALCDQLNATVSVIDLSALDPTSSSAIIWTWKPTANLGFASTSGYANSIDEAILRYSEITNSYVVCVTSSSGFMAVVEYPSGKCIWSANASSYGPHSIEYLPNGNVAVALSGNSNTDNGCIRIYTASQGKTSGKFISLPLKSAHGVIWDDKNELLWALGYDEIIAYRIVGTQKDPQAIRVAGLGGKLPKSGGHNLSVNEHDPDLLWISSSSVYQFRKSTGAFVTDYDGQSKIGITAIKSVDSFADGMVIMARATNVYKAHNTDTLLVFNFDLSGNVLQTKYVFTNRAFYKARRFNAYYS